MASAKWTLIGMYNYDNTIFNDMVLPTGIDADLFKSSLLIEKGEFEVLYPDPDFMKQSIKVWSAKWFRTFSEWLKGTQAQWNPIYNYDRYEEGWDDHNKKYASVNNADYSDKRTAGLKDESTFNNQDTTSQTKESTTEHQVAGYDSSTYQPSSKDSINNGDSNVKHTGTVTNETTGTDEHVHKGKLSDISGTEKNTNQHTAHLFGNIGVTTSSTMLAEFYNIAKWNLYEHMADVFGSELLIQVY